jgi:hypothetical protein
LAGASEIEQEVSGFCWGRRKGRRVEWQEVPKKRRSHDLFQDEWTAGLDELIQGPERPECWRNWP